MNHETQRLLVAASRGARVQTAYTDRWMNTSVLYTCSSGLQRIHPDDTHLQYGPISTELRRMAEHGLENFDGITYLAENWLHVCFGREKRNVVDIRWLYAFAAELAADEGM